MRRKGVRHHGFLSVVSNPNCATAFATHFFEPHGRPLLIA